MHPRLCVTAAGVLYSSVRTFNGVALCMKDKSIFPIDGGTGLVLEGGAMRGVFTSGVLDAFMKHGLYFNYVVAVSAGACNGLSYMSRQKRRARISNIDFLAKYKYIGLRHLLTQGNIFNSKLLYDDFPNKLIPFDYDAYFNNPATFEMVTTNCLTGTPCYLTERKDRRRLLDIVRASSSMPYMSDIVNVDGIPMLDGGIRDSIPFMRAIECGHKRCVVIATRNRGYRSNEKDRKTPWFLYREYPLLREALSHRCEAYNRQLQLLEGMEHDGLLFVIRPERPVEVGRMEKDLRKLELLYEEGFVLGERFVSSVM